MDQEIQNFLNEIDKKQRLAYSKIALFNKTEIEKWTSAQKQWFVKVLYHVRGHFDRLLWMRLMSSNTKADKERILTYMAEEAGLEDGKNWPSHEQLFEKFASALGVKLTADITEHEGYLPFIRDFNFNLISYFKAATQEMQEIYFMAYERLDNLDYASLYQTALALDISGEPLIFFEVHKNAKHFEKTSGNIEKFWNKNPTKLKEGFQMIYDNQLQMLQGLSDSIFNYNV